MTEKSTSSTRPDPYPVYSDLLREALKKYKPKCIAVHEYTDDLRSSEECTLLIVKGADDHMLADFCAANKDPQRLEPRFDPALNVLLYTKEERKRIMALDNDHVWVEFYKLFPGSAGSVTLSGVGFSEDGKKALVNMGCQSGWMSGSGNQYLLRHNGKCWEIEDENMLWIS